MEAMASHIYVPTGGADLLVCLLSAKHACNKKADQEVRPTFKRRRKKSNEPRRVSCGLG
jgi:hypothetical protein